MLKSWKGGLLTALVLCATSATAAPLKTRDVIDLWPGVAPGSEASTATLTVTERSKVLYWPDRAITGVIKPNLTAFVPDKPNGAAVIVAPGGAYTRIVLDKEAGEMARWLNPYGVTVLLLQYRLPAEGHQNGADVPLEDAQRAVRLVRSRAREWGLDPNRIGFLGASAAGHMGATLGAEFAKKVYAPVDEADKLSARPDFLMLLYPVVSMDEKVTHMESRTNLIGKTPSAEQIQAYSANLHVTKDNPPTFITLANDDPAVSPENGLSYFLALRQAGVPVEMHIFKDGNHGFGIRDTRQMPVSRWPNFATEWLKAIGILN
ncbi:alpha/beta hydrolase [Uliginosibacterium sp. 31-16]|uniref:alpha/beta hydrolase n=1 Tax=Uliginosibacterium sp. 31-16 TaxID=3068315 RepID=UPI00273E38A8|nr:alpha/beta hydrolase [Uliginosibacterium sp. 31-16]MDP5239027.1 alpha/beta hydrolase [Uliginosibacterium sp. 31-16]